MPSKQARQFRKTPCFNPATEARWRRVSRKFSGLRRARRKAETCSPQPRGAPGGDALSGCHPVANRDPDEYPGFTQCRHPGSALPGWENAKTAVFTQAWKKTNVRHMRYEGKGREAVAFPNGFAENASTIESAYVVSDGRNRTWRMPESHWHQFALLRHPNLFVLRIPPPEKKRDHPTVSLITRGLRGHLATHRV